MRKLLCIFFVIIAGVYCNAQPVLIQANELKNDTLKTKEGPNYYTIVLRNSLNTPVAVKISYKDISTAPGDYRIEGIPPDGLLKVENKEIFLHIKINQDGLSEPSESFQLIIDYLGIKPTNDTIIVNIEGDGKSFVNNDEKKTAGVNKIMFLNAYNFDFGSTSLSSNYVGHLNLYAPDISDRWGFNTGIMKINYGQNDTTVNEVQIIENTLINPYNELHAGDKYLKQVNSYKTQRSNTAWSFYVQPLYRLTNDDSKSNIYAHAHLELLATKWTSKTTITNIRQDTSVYTPAPGFVAKKLLANTSSYKINSLFGYFGVGFTFDLKPWNSGSFFFQTTIGKTSNYPQPSSVDINNPVFPINKKEEHTTQWHSFYLIRAYYTHQLSENTTVVVGTDIRGLFPLYDPLYAAYVGLNISLDKAFELITGKK